MNSTDKVMLKLKFKHEEDKERRDKEKEELMEAVKERRKVKEAYLARVRAIKLERERL